MKRLAAAVAACLWLAACTTTNTKLAIQDGAKPAAGARVLLVDPDVSLALLTAAGLQEPRADWSEQGRSNLASEIEAEMRGRAHAFDSLDPSTARAGRVGQLMRLHQAVGGSILLFSYGPHKLPSKAEAFDWTLGHGARALGEAHGADYALFVTAGGSYASGARIATAVGMSLLGVGVPLGSQQAFASLVDLKTGQVVWFNVVQAGPNADMREAEGAAALVDALLKDVPL